MTHATQSEAHHRQLANSGRLVEAEEVIWSRLSSEDDLTAVNRHRLFTDLMTIYSRQLRTSETLATARILIKSERVPAALRFHALRMTAEQWLMLGERRRARHLARTIRHQLDESELPATARFCAHELLFKLARISGDTPSAGVYLEAIRAHLDLDPSSELLRIARPKYEAEFHLLNREMERAAAVYDALDTETLAVESVPAVLGFHLEHADICVRAGFTSQATVVLTRLIADLVEYEQEGAPPGILLSHGLTAFELAISLGATVLREKAKSVLLPAMVRRVEQLDEVADRLPIANVAREVQHGLSNSVSWRQLIEDAGDLLLDAAERGEGANILADGVLAHCAWCSRVRSERGNWLPIGHLLLCARAKRSTTHGICDDCGTEVEG